MTIPERACKNGLQNLDPSQVDIAKSSCPKSDAIEKQPGDRVVVRCPKALSHWGVAFNVAAKPFDDECGRKALSVAVNRYEMANVLGFLTGLETPGGITHPQSEWILSPEELQEMPGFGKDHEANLKEAKRLSMGVERKEGNTLFRLLSKAAGRHLDFRHPTLRLDSLSKAR